MSAPGVSPTGRPQRRGFTMVEMVMVVTIIGIVAAIAVPRVSSTASHASANALQATLTSVRGAIDCYYAEHNRYPGYNPVNFAPSGADFVKQLTLYSDIQGRTNATKTTGYRFGPYLRSPFPANPTNKLGTVHVKLDFAAADPGEGSVGWVAVLSAGEFGLSATDAELDKIGVLDVEDKRWVKGGRPTL